MLKNIIQRNWIAKSLAKLVIITSLFYIAFQPTLSAESSYRQYTPIYAIEKNSDAAKKIIEINENISEKDAGRFVHYAKKWGETFGVDPSLILGIMFVESTFDKYAISNMGARGLMQVLPKWHKDKIQVAKMILGNKKELSDPELNIYVGSWILKECMIKYENRANSLKCYNGAVGKKTDYHKKVLNGKKEFDSFI